MTVNIHFVYQDGNIATVTTIHDIILTHPALLVKMLSESKVIKQCFFGPDISLAACLAWCQSRILVTFIATYNTMREEYQIVQLGD